MEYVGKVFVDFDTDLTIKWKDSKKPPEFQKDDVLVLKFRDWEIVEITIGSLRDITEPVMITWISKEIGPAKDEGMVCKVYKKERSIK